MKSGSLQSVQNGPRNGLFRLIQCARDEGFGLFPNEFIDLFDSIVAYLTVTTFVSFNFQESRNKIIQKCILFFKEIDGVFEKS